MGLVEINAIAFLEYWEGKSITGGSERLKLVVKFKEKGKFFKTSLGMTLASEHQVFNSDSYMEEDRFETYDEYYECVEETISDEVLIKEVAEKMIRDYFEKERNENNKDERVKEILGKIGNSKPLNIKVKID